VNVPLAASVPVDSVELLIVVLMVRLVPAGRMKPGS